MPTPNDPRLIASAIRKLELQKLSECFDSRDLDSRPSPKQQLIMDDIGKISVRYLIAANQIGKCLVKGTLVATPNGPKPIEEIRIGDTVYSEHGLPIKVKNVFDNGVKEVADLTNRGKTYASCTDVHVWKGAKFSQTDGSLIEEGEYKAGDFKKGIRVKRMFIQPSLGSVEVSDAYAIGALLGDGCSREKAKTSLYISSANSLIPDKVAALLNAVAAKTSEMNYTWKMTAASCSYYEDWCRGRYAHEKLCDLEEIKTWNRDSLLRFFAGVFDTEGGICRSKDQLSLRIGMQAQSVIDVLHWAALALWQVDVKIYTDSRDKYKNGPLYYISIGNPSEAKRVLKELTKHLVSPQKQWKAEYETIGGKRSQEDYISLKFGENKRFEHVYDIHVDSDTNLYLLANGLITHNTSIGCREMAWLLNDNHPKWKRPKEWGTGPLFMIIVSQSRALISKEIWERKLKPLLIDKEDWKEQTTGGNVMAVRNVKTGSEIQFLVHGSGSDEMRQQLQGFRAHYVLLDEMPKDYSAYTELLMRIHSYNGYMFVAFTPLLQNMELKNAIENAAAPFSRKYKLIVWDNPENLKPANKARIEQLMALMPERERNTRFFGEWSAGDEGVFYIDDAKTLVQLPKHYSKEGWRHVEVVDPAGTGITGLTIWAQDPQTNVWICVKAEYIKGGHDNSPANLVKKVMELTQGYHIVRRIADTMPWYYTTAKQMYNLVYMRPHNKVQRKEDLIKNLQEALTSGKILISTEARLLFEELLAMRYNEQGKIIQHQHWHVTDCAQYFVDLMPPNVLHLPNVSRDMYIMEMHEKGKKKEAQRKNMHIRYNRRFR